jgi:hypothetical protein
MAKSSEYLLPFPDLVVRRASLLRVAVVSFFLLPLPLPVLVGILFLPCALAMPVLVIMGVSGMVSPPNLLYVRKD